MISSPEALATVTHKAFHTCVSSNVAQELICPSKTTPTIYILTDIWPLSPMPENVGLQVHRLGEGFIANQHQKVEAITHPEHADTPTHTDTHKKTQKTIEVRNCGKVARTTLV